MIDIVGHNLWLNNWAALIFCVPYRVRWVSPIFHSWAVKIHIFGVEQTCNRKNMTANPVISQCTTHAMLSITYIDVFSINNPTPWAQAKIFFFAALRLTSSEMLLDFFTIALSWNFSDVGPMVLN